MSSREHTLKRIRFEKQGDLRVSQQMFSNGEKLVRLILNPLEMIFTIVDATTGHVYITGGDNINNYEVLQRNGKKALAEFLDIEFTKERKKVAKSKYSLR